MSYPTTAQLTEVDLTKRWESLVRFADRFIPPHSRLSAEDLVQDMHVTLWRNQPEDWPWEFSHMVQTLKWATWTALKRAKVTEELGEYSTTVRSAEAEGLANIELANVIELAAERPAIAVVLLTAMGYKAPELAAAKGSSQMGITSTVYQGRRELKQREAGTFKLKAKVGPRLQGVGLDAVGKVRRRRS